MNNLILMTESELSNVTGGFDAWTVVSGVGVVAAGVGLMAIAVVPGVNVVAAAAVAYAGSWGIAGGVTILAFGLT